MCKELNEVLKKNSSQKISDFLDSLGFFHAKFDSISRKVFPGKRAIVIKEIFQKNDSLPLELIGKIEYPRKFDAGEIKRRALQLNRVYAENGFPFATVEIDIMPIDYLSSVDSMVVTYKINSDRLTRFSGPLFNAAKKTSPSLLSKYIAFKPGELFDIRKVEKSIDALKKRTFIEDASSFSSLLLTDSLNQDSICSVSVPFEIKDRSGLGFEGIAGFESDQNEKPQLQGNAHFSLLNLFHSGESVSFLYMGNKTEQQFDIAFSKPWIFNIPLQIGGNLGMEIEKEKYGYVYGKCKLLTEFNFSLYAGLGFQYQETSVKTDSSGSDGTYYGLNFLFLKIPQTFSKGVLSSELTIDIGSGVSKKERNYTRSHIDFSIGSHFPIWRSQAIYTRLVTAHIMTKEESLLAVEMNRVGGYNSIRGYTDNEFAFRTVLYGQLEGIHYFNTTGSIFIFLDGGIGFENEPTSWKSDYSKLFGYGIGFRIPSRIGLMTLEWARNLQDKKNPGRIHVQFQNDLSRLTGKFL